MLEVRLSACVPPGVRVKFLVMGEGRWGYLVVGSTGRKRIRWSRAWVGGIVVVGVWLVGVLGFALVVDLGALLVA